MKKLILFLFLGLFSISFSQNVSPQFSELKGMEDQSANTHLFYRIYSLTSGSIWYPETLNDIYHFDLLSGIDTLFLESYDRLDTILQIPEYHFSNDVQYWNDDPGKFIYCGTMGNSMEGNAFIKRFDSDNNYNKEGVVNNIQISSQNDSLLYAGVSVYDTSGLTVTVKSTDGGWNWTKILGPEQFISLSLFNDQTFFARDVISLKLKKTTDSGNSYYLVDSSLTYWEQQYHYDSDENHIYKIARNYYTNDYELKISPNSGEAFSWEVKHTAQDKIFISNNESVTGEVYLADRKSIFLSTDYGDNFNLYKSLDRKIVGIYKKSNSDKLYAATKYKIYEIAPDSIQVIKRLPIPEDAFAWLPLNQGDMWVRYHEEINNPGDSIKFFSKSKVVGYKSLHNKVYTKVLETHIPIDSSTSYGTSINYFRVDSLNGIIYRSFFQNDSILTFESFLIDLLVEVGDTIPFGHGAYLESEIPFTQFGVSSFKRTFRTVPPWGQQFELVKGFGTVADSVWYPHSYKAKLLGCIINGIVYGDTTLVSVEDEEPNLPTEFSLSQNYPNPFNPTTTIKFTIPTSPLNPSPYQGEGQWERLISLKVYDVLGNEIATLVNEEKPAGNYEVEFSTGLIHQTLSSGIYFYQLRAGSYSATKKMVLLK